MRSKRHRDRAGNDTRVDYTLNSPYKKLKREKKVDEKSRFRLRGVVEVVRSVMYVQTHFVIIKSVDKTAVRHEGRR